MKLYTKKGDKGRVLLNGKLEFKDNIYFECIGTIDELNSVLGLAKSFSEDEQIVKYVTVIQKDLFIIGGALSQNRDICSIDEEKIVFLENIIDMYMEEICLQDFIIPGSSRRAAHFHVARTVCRRAERLLIAYLKNQEELNKGIIKYINRLSDLLFAIAVFLEENLESPIKNI